MAIFKCNILNLNYSAKFDKEIEIYQLIDKKGNSDSHSGIFYTKDIEDDIPDIIEDSVETVISIHDILNE
jgi:hypothetical protein